MFNYYEGDSILHRMNPVLKLGSIGISMIILTFSFDPFVPFMLLITLLILSLWLGKVPILAMCKGLIPFFTLALGFFIMQVAFPRGASGAELFNIGNFVVYQESFMRGIALGLRVLAFSAYALLFVATTDPTELLLSLMQQAKLPPKYGYSILAAYRFFPLYQSEFTNLKEAHQVRGASERKGLKGKFEELRRYAIPLLAQAIRKAERVAIAMEARGFTGEGNRHYHKQVSVHSVDWVLAMGLLGLVPVFILIINHFGLLQVWDGSAFF